MNAPCPTKIDCFPCRDEPILNVSAESPDQDRFISRFAFLNAVPPIRQYPDFDHDPGAAGIFLQVGCMRWCWSTISQDDADLCAARQAVECAFDPLVPNVPPPPSPLVPNRIALYFNLATTGKYTCPDGTMFFYTLPANQIAGVSQGQINRAAQAVADSRARAHRICLSNLDDPICEGSFYTNRIVATGPYVAVFPAQDFWELVGGTLPPGMMLDTGFSSNGIGFSGVATTIGTYSFTVRCTLRTLGSPGFGDFMQKTFTVRVVGINESSPLPDAMLGTPYSQQLTAASSTDVAGEFWSVVSGNLPDGLSMDEHGLISGTPTGALAGYAFTAQVFYFVGGNKALCTKNFTITTQSVGLLAYWDFQDAAPDYDDLTGNSQTLVNTFPPAPFAAAGIIGLGAQLTETTPPFVGTPTFLQASLNAVSFTPNGWTAFGWMNCIFGTAGHASAVGILTTSGGFGSSSLVMDLHTAFLGSFNRLELLVGNTGPVVNDSITSQLLADGWNFWIIWWDSTTGKMSLQVNDAAVMEVASTWNPGIPINEPGQFTISGFSASVPHPKVVDETGVIAKVLTAAQRTALYNAGAAATWPQVQSIVQS